MQHSHEALDRPGGFAKAGLLSPLRHRDFRVLWAGMAVSLLGDGIFLIAIAWETYALWNAPAALSIVGIAMTVPTIVFLLVGGVLSDRHDRRRLMLAADAVRAAAVACLAVLVFAGALQLWELVVLVALYGAGTAFFTPAFEAIVPDLLPRQDLAAANSLDQFVRPIALRLAGPLLGGLLVAAGAGLAFAVDAASFAVSGIAVLAMRPPRTPRAAPSVSHAGAVREGLSFIRGDPVLRWVIALSIATALLTRPYIQLLPAEAQLLGVGAVQLSWLLAASGAGALLGALSTASLGNWRYRGALLVGGSLSHGILLTFFGFQHTVLGAMIFIGLTSFAVMLFMGMANTLMQTRTPDHLRGRAMSVHTMVFMGFMPLGQMLLGSVGTLIGIDHAFILGGLVVVALASYVAFRVPAMREAVSLTPPRVVARSG